MLKLVQEKGLEIFCNTHFASQRFGECWKRVLGKFHNSGFQIFKVWQNLNKKTRSHNMGGVQHMWGCISFQRQKNDTEKGDDVDI